MKNTNSKEFKHRLKAYITEAINGKAEGYGIPSPEKPFQWILETAKNEVSHEFRNGDQAGMEYFLSGLGISIDYNYCDIIRVSEALHGETMTEKQRDMVCENWFRFLASKIVQFSRE